MSQKTNYMRPWTKQEDDILKILYPDASNSQMCEALNRGKHAIKRRADMLGLTRSDSYIERMSRRKHLFVPGGKPWNAGDGSPEPKKITTKAVRAYQFRNDKEKTSFEVMLAAITSVEQAMNLIVKSNDKRAVS